MSDYPEVLFLLIWGALVALAFGTGVAGGGAALLAFGVPCAVVMVNLALEDY